MILVGSDYWGKLYEFMQSSMMAYGTINQADLDLIHIVDDIDEVVQIVDRSLHTQLQAIEEMGLSESNYGEMLKSIEQKRG